MTTNSDPDDDPATFDPFRDYRYSGRARRDDANAVLAESIRRAEEDLKTGSAEINRRFGEELRARIATASTRGQLPSHLLQANTTTDTDGEDAA